MQPKGWMSDLYKCLLNTKYKKDEKLNKKAKNTKKKKLFMYTTIYITREEF